MAVPTNKHSKARTRARRANHDKTRLAPPVMCDHCGADKVPHRICPSCGHHRGRFVFLPKGHENLPTAEV